MTIYDIAKAAGVSASSVSRVVNNKPGVSRERREKIHKLLEQYNYVPNETARGLVTSSSKLVGILMPDVRGQHHSEGTYHIVSELAKRGYCGLILNTGYSEAECTAGLRLLKQRKVEAAVLMGSIFQTDAIREAILRSLPDVPVFMLNGYLELPNVYGVLADERTGAADCVDLLRRKGRRNIAFFVDRVTPSSVVKLAGFKSGMRELGVSGPDTWVYKAPSVTLEGGHRLMCQVLKEHPEVDGLICCSDIIACGALRALLEAGRCVPEDVAVVGIDNSVYAELCTPRLTSLNNMILESSVVIAHELVNCLEGCIPNKKTMLFTSIVEREST